MFCGETFPLIYCFSVKCTIFLLLCYQQISIAQQVINSLYLPPKEILSRTDKDTAYNLYHNKNKTIAEISEIIDVPINDLNELLNPPEFIKESDYRVKEYEFLTTEESINDRNLSFTQEVSDKLSTYGIKRLLKINRLKLSSVQTGFSRQEPIDKDLYEVYSMDDFILTNRNSVKAKYTSSKGNKVDILPGVENFGEGIFIEFSKDKIIDWYKGNSQNNMFIERIQNLARNARISEFGLTEEKNKMIQEPEYLAKFLLIHTFSHILIKELEFLVGYPATSLSERLYINENKMQGILIYTIAGAEGSFGGLVSQANTERFIKILHSAIIRAQDCASDPICYNSEGQGIGGLNLAACYSCTLLPETSCEEFNSYLDRGILIDKTENFGFYNF